MRIGEQEFVTGFNDTAKRVHQTAKEHGWWEDKSDWFIRTVNVAKEIGTQNITLAIEDAEKLVQDGLNTRSEGELIALMHSELSEALESARHDHPQSDHIPLYSLIEEEFADVIIRIMDHAQKHGYKVAEALVAKMEYNENRPYRHGGKRF